MYDNSNSNNEMTQYTQYNQQYPQNQQYQPSQQRQMYAPQQYNQYIQVAQPTESNPVSVGDWMLTTLLLCIPIVNIILIFVWAFGGTAPKSKENFFKAYLIWVAIGIGFMLIYYIAILALLS